MITRNYSEGEPEKTLTVLSNNNNKENIIIIIIIIIIIPTLIYGRVVVLN
jgi:hypothetical protein